MKKNWFGLLAIAAAPFMLAACDPVGGINSAGSVPAGVDAAADTVMITGTKGLLVAETWYVAMAQSAVSMIKSGSLKDPATLGKINRVNTAAMAAFDRAKIALDAGDEARTTIEAGNILDLANQLVLLGVSVVQPKLGSN